MVKTGQVLSVSCYHHSFDPFNDFVQRSIDDRIIMRQTFAAEPYSESGNSFEFDSSTCTLRLKGNVELDEIKNFDQKEAVKWVFGAPGAVLPDNCNQMFMDYVNCERIGLAESNTNNVVSMHQMFKNCEKLKEVDFKCESQPETFPNAVVLSDMFMNCKSLESVDVSSFAENRLEIMGGMFYNCSSLKSVDLTGFDTSLIKSMAYLFYGCSSLTSVDLSPLDTSSVKSFAFMFKGCSGLTSIDVSGFDKEQRKKYLH